MNTLMLTSNWDLTADASKNIAMATNGYAIAQDVASAIRTVLGELWYDTEQGVPYFTNILGQRVSLSLIRNYFNKAALMVPGVVKAQTTLNPLTSNRTLTGSVKVIDTNGQALSVTF
jgi:hypothetical protein